MLSIWQLGITCGSMIIPLQGSAVCVVGLILTKTSLMYCMSSINISLLMPVSLLEGIPSHRYELWPLNGAFLWQRKLRARKFVLWLRTTIAGLLIATQLRSNWRWPGLVALVSQLRPD